MHSWISPRKELWNGHLYVCIQGEYWIPSPLSSHVQSREHRVTQGAKFSHCTSFALARDTCGDELCILKNLATAGVNTTVNAHILLL